MNNSRLPGVRPQAAPAAPAEGGVRSDADNLHIIGQKRALHESLRNEKVRVERDIETNEQRLTEALATAKAKFGTDDIEALREMVRDTYRANSEETDAYAAKIDEVEQGLAALKTSAA